MAGVAVVGGGAIGGWLAAGLAHAGHDVALCVRTPVDRLFVDDVEVPVRITADPADVEPVPWVLLATKAQDTAGAQPWLDRLLDDDSTVVVVQNGIDHEERMQAPSVLPALAYVAVERVEPDRIRTHTPGWLEVPDTALGTAFATLAGSGMRVDLAADFRTNAWRKLYANSAANPLGALTLSRMGRLRTGELRDLAARVLHETVEVSVADGAAVDPDAEVARILERWSQMDPGGGSSMLYDRLAGRPMEHEYITGAVVRYADKHGHPAPLNRTLLTLLRALDQSR
ncbi:2-dehydropantoate 2-reductase [Labedaea rhizosphaerae]|uniref:2-dehydropantoate 2-reductase n=1 Tax=Labedaea rhizosphaerae TaxID=598644 RepID=A0A4R6SLD3_LABRH|nr:2-dehydropantoate 2-reductase [Labedaea rhizosphaerae]TDQ05018.1 ketopantoate reductase [Labedaea rhizosphaerae]